MGDPGKGKKWTLIKFMDGTQLRVWWDGNHEVSWRSEPVVIYGPGEKLTMFPFHVIFSVVHQGGEDQ